MRRFFNTTGPVVAENHYCIPESAGGAECPRVGHVRLPQLHQVAASQAFNAVVIAGGRGSHPRAANESLFVERVHCNVDVFLAVAEPLADGLRRVQALVADSGLRLYTWSMQRLREEWPVILIVATIAGAAWMAAWNVQGFIATQIAASEARLTAQILETREQIAETREQVVEIRKYIVDHSGDHSGAD